MKRSNIGRLADDIWLDLLPYVYCCKHLNLWNMDELGFNKSLLDNYIDFLSKLSNQAKVYIIEKLY